MGFKTQFDKRKGGLGKWIPGTGVAAAWGIYLPGGRNV